MAWAKPQYAKSRIDWAGEILARSHEVDDTAELETAQEIVNNWRAVHSYPLQVVKMALKGRAKRICPGAIVAQRLKRIASIKLKLRVSSDSGNHPNLSQMQDIGGCRAVMDTVAQVRELERAFEEASKKNPHRGPQYSKKTDYLECPRSSGYRGVHLIYRYRTTSEEHECYNGQRIEIQLRTKIQHYWATAVETYSTFSGEALKSNIGSDKWKRFFALMATAMAISEGTPVVAGTYDSRQELIAELQLLYKELNAEKVLSGWTAATRLTETEERLSSKDAAMYLLVLNPNEFKISVTSYKSSELAEASAEYAQREKEPSLQTVLVSVDSLAALRTAYPNYFLDTTAFLEEVRKVLSPA
jgi:ppGpp synthetase/RelA/SpoT-type nucleotidyltranferase